MLCDVAIYDRYQCNNTDIAGSCDCKPPAPSSGTGTAGAIASSADRSSLVQASETALPASAAITITVVPLPSFTGAVLAPPSSSTAVVLPTSTSHRGPSLNQECACDPDTGPQIFRCGGNQTLFQLFAPAGTPHWTRQAKDLLGRKSYIPGWRVFLYQWQLQPCK